MLLHLPGEFNSGPMELDICCQFLFLVSSEQKGNL